MDTIQNVLHNNQLQIYLQPIISVRGRVIFGVEALVRGISTDKTLLSPAWLFSEASNANLTFELDQRARHMAIEAFLPLWKKNPKLLLFVNFESSLIDNFETGNYLFDGLLRRYEIPYSNIVLEIKEDHIKSTEKLKKFCNHYRNLGFLIALDDFGIGRSSFDRLAAVLPDIIKIDRSLISDLHNNYIHREIVQAICKMSNNIGALTLAEGVETMQEAVYSKHLGATLLQGFWLAKPSLEPITEELRTKTMLVNMLHKEMILDKANMNEKLRKKAEKLTHTFSDVVAKLSDHSKWNMSMHAYLDAYPDVEAIYLIGENAIQVDDTLMQSPTRMFFEPTKAGCDHSCKEYYIRATESRQGFHITKSYLSLATGHACITYASVIRIKNKQFILCIDFIQQSIARKINTSFLPKMTKEKKDQILTRSSKARVRESTSTFSKLTPVGTPCAIRVNDKLHSASLSSI